MPAKSTKTTTDEETRERTRPYGIDFDKVEPTDDPRLADKKPSAKTAPSAKVGKSTTDEATGVDDTDRSVRDISTNVPDEDGNLDDLDTVPEDENGKKVK